MDFMDDVLHDMIKDAVDHMQTLMGWKERAYKDFLDYARDLDEQKASWEKLVAEYRQRQTATIS